MASIRPNLHPSPHMSSEFKPKKRMKTPPSFPHPTSNQWTTQQRQQIYSSKLIQALRHSPPSSSSVAAKQVHETADRVLAVSAKGTMRWSRAILTTPLRAAGANMTKYKKPKLIAYRRLRKPEINTEKSKLPDVQRKLKVLGRLVPGCRKLSFSNLLEETSDYIAALEMQVRTMTTIAEFLACDGSVEAQTQAQRLGSNVNS